MLLERKLLAEIADQLDMGFRCFIHKQTHEIISWPNEDQFYGMDTEGWQDEMDKFDNSPTDYIEIDKMDSTRSYSVMEDFVNSLPNNSTKVRLIQALEGAKPFRNFNHQIHNSDEYRQDWFDFKKERAIEYVKRQLDHDYE